LNYLIVGNESLGLGVGSRSTASSLLINESSQFVVVVSISEGERAAVEGGADDQLIGRATKVDPQLQTVILQRNRA